MGIVDLSIYDNSEYKPGGIIRRTLWGVVDMIFFCPPIPFPYRLKTALLRAFGARIGRNVVFKPGSRIKYPWFLEIGDFSWMGEDVYVHNLGAVTIGKNVCISQGAYLSTGNHDYKKAAFDLVIKEVSVEDGAWIGAKAIVGPGITVRTHSVITIGSVVTGSTEPYTIYKGNPARPVRKRVISE